MWNGWIYEKSIKYSNMSGIGEAMAPCPPSPSGYATAEKVTNTTFWKFANKLHI
jgi:hypothetical protein